MMARFATLALFALALLCGSMVAWADPPSEPVEAILCRATSALGFSYAWGGECWCADGCEPDFVSCDPGDCTPNSGSGGCPDCTHTGTYGADCSGFVSRAWQVPRPLSVDACGTARYVASDFTSDHEFWDPVSVASLRPGDAAATGSHVVLVVGDAVAGEYEIIEARGCNYGIVRRRRSLSTYQGARRINLSDCICDEGEGETRDCGDCGTQERLCDDGCLWSEWSSCEGPDPGDGEEPCTVEGATGACAEGQWRCVAGWVTCESPSAATEICDGEDNDCDGVVDNGTPNSLGEGYPCANACGQGESECIDGALRCVTPGTTWPDDSCNEGESGPDGGAGDGGTGDGDSGGGGSEDGGDIPATTASGGCNCGVVGEAEPRELVLVLALLGAVALGRRRGFRPPRRR